MAIVLTGVVLLSIFRFFKNPRQDNFSQVISRTIGKVALAISGYQGVLPEPGEFWICDIIAETCPGRVSGCFLVEPYMKVPYEELVILTPSSCTLRTHRSNSVKGDITIIVDPVISFTPEGNRIPWFFPLRQRVKLRDKSVISVVTNLGGNPWEFWDKERARENYHSRCSDNFE